MTAEILKGAVAARSRTSEGLEPSLRLYIGVWCDMDLTYFWWLWQYPPELVKADKQEDEKVTVRQHPVHSQLSTLWSHLPQLINCTMTIAIKSSFLRCNCFTTHFYLLWPICFWLIYLSVYPNCLILLHFRWFSFSLAWDWLSDISYQDGKTKMNQPL